jgi:hypothetical protein
MLRSFVAVLAIVFSITGCDAEVVPTTPPVTAPAPAATDGPPGMLHLTSEGMYDQHPLHLTYLTGGARIDGETIDEDIEVIVNRPMPPGSLQVHYNDLLCAGSVEIESNVETDVLFDFGVESCSISTTATHAPGSVAHRELPTTASVGAFLPFGVPSVFVVRSLDDPGAAPIAEVAVMGPPWEAAQVVVEPGRYELSVRIDGVTLAHDELDLERGEDRIVNLRVLPPDVPRDCGETAATLCEEAITAGYGRGLFLDGTTIVTSVTVRPTKYASCDGQVAPEFDVRFGLAKPAGESEVTVGRLPDGRLSACTY